MAKFVMASTAEALQAVSPHFTVEAEFGEVMVTGSMGSLGHHGPRSHLPPPCILPNLSVELPDDAIIGLSHLDLDALGGCMAVLGIKPAGSDSFFDLAGKIDVLGAHKLPMLCASEVDQARLYAFWAYSQSHRVFPSKDGSVSDVTSQIEAAISAVQKILQGDAELISAGEQFRLASEQLDRSSFVKQEGGVIMRSSASFVNHLYRDGIAVVARNTETGAITMSLAEHAVGVSCREIMQGLFGPTAGGHDGIAGSPRGQVMSESDLVIAFETMRAALI